MVLLLAAGVQCRVSTGLRLAIYAVHRVRGSNATKMQHLKLIVGLAACRKLNYKLAPKTTELAVCKDTRSSLKFSALLPLARRGAARAPRERLARGGTGRKIHFLSFLWMCRRPSTDTAPSET